MFSSLFPMFLTSVDNSYSCISHPQRRQQPQIYPCMWNSITAKTKHSLQMFTPRWKLQCFLHRRIQQMFWKWSKRTQWSCHQFNLQTWHSNNHLQANIFYLKIVDQDSKQVVREAREATYIRIINPALTCSTGKMHIPEIFNHFLEDRDLPLSLANWWTQTSH